MTRIENNKETNMLIDVKRDILHQLNYNEAGINIEFLKVNGELRKMLSTLCPDLILENMKSDNYKYEPEEVLQHSAINVFDIDKQEWRSFRWDSVIAFGGDNA